MLWLMLMFACEPMVIGLEEADTTAPMEWHSRVQDCLDNSVQVDVGARWQFIQVFSYYDDEWSPLAIPWRMKDGTLSFECYSDTEQFRVSWVNLP